MSPRADCTQSNACSPPSGRALGPFGRIPPGCPGAFGSTCQCPSVAHTPGTKDVVGEPLTGPPLHLSPTAFLIQYDLHARIIKEPMRLIFDAGAKQILHT